MEKPSWWRRDLILLYLSVTTARIGFGVIIIVFPSYLIGTSDITLAVVLALYPILEAISAVPIGGLCDAKGRKVIFVSGLGTMALLIASIGLTRNLWVISTVHSLMGIAAASITVSSLTMITDLTRMSNRGKGMGAFDFANIGGYAVGLILGGRLHDYFEGRPSYPFYVTAIAMLAALVLSLVLLREPFHFSGLSRKIELNPLRILDERTKAILPMWLSLTALLGIVFFLPRALRDLGFRATITGDVLFLGILVLGLGSIGFGTLSDVIGREKTMTIGVVGLFFLLMSLGLAFGSRGGPRFFDYLFILGPSALATSALVPSILAAVGDRAREEHRGASMGLYSLMLSLGIAAGELIAGFAHSIGGFSGILEGGAILFLVASIASFLMLRKLRRLLPTRS